MASVTAPRSPAQAVFELVPIEEQNTKKMVGGNAAIHDHQREGRALRVFIGSRGVVTYLDEFVLDGVQAWYETDAPETNDGPLRKVIVFRLRPVNIRPQPSESRLSLSGGGTPKRDEAVFELVPIEEQNTERAIVEPSRKPYE